MALSDGFQLDRRWHWLMGQMERRKEPDLLLLAKLLDSARTPYAVIRGVALQVHQREPRTTIDIDITVLSLASLPRSVLEMRGFQEKGHYAPSDNWVAPEGTPVQFTDDPALSAAIARAVPVSLGEVSLKVLAVADLLHEKLRAGRDPARRRSKRLQDFADAQSLLEQRPELEGELSSEERSLLDELPE